MISDILSALRKRKRWTLQYVADRLGIAKSTYAGYESGYREPSLEVLIKLADLFQTSADHLLGRPLPPGTIKSESHQVMDLTALLNASDIHVAIDGIRLTAAELEFLIALMRTKRNLTND